MQKIIKHRSSGASRNISCDVIRFVLFLFSSIRKVQQLLLTHNTHRSLCKGGQEVSIVMRSCRLADLLKKKKKKEKDECSQTSQTKQELSVQG